MNLVECKMVKQEEYVHYLYIKHAAGLYRAFTDSMGMGSTHSQGASLIVGLDSVPLIGTFHNTPQKKKGICIIIFKHSFTLSEIGTICCIMHEGKKKIQIDLHEGKSVMADLPQVAD